MLRPLAVPLDVDTLSTESSASGVIDTGSSTPPVTILTPSSGRRISTRGAYLFSNSDTGTITMKYQNSNNVILKVYCDKFKVATTPKIRFDGPIDASIVIEWEGLSSGSEILWILSYKEV